MNLKRAIWMSIIAYLVSFVFGLAIVALGGGDAFSENIEFSTWLTLFIFLIILVYIFASWYFKDKKIKASSKEGFRFALVLFLVSAILDLAVLIPYVLTSGNSSEALAYYASPWFSVAVLLMIATGGFVGYKNQKGK